MEFGRNATTPCQSTAAHSFPSMRDHSFRSIDNNIHNNISGDPFQLAPVWISDADNFIQTNMMMKSVSTPHKYVLKDEEIEQSLQELDETVASLEGGDLTSLSATTTSVTTPAAAVVTHAATPYHRRTLSSSSSRQKQRPSDTVAPIDETASIASIVTERSHAVLMHRHLIDNIETISWRNKHSLQNHHQITRSSGCSRKSSSSRRSKRSMAQRSLASNRSKQRGPSLERAIFQTLFRAARSDSADAHFSISDDDRSMPSSSTESILKDLIQADAIWSVEVGSLRSNNLLSPLATEEEPDLLPSLPPRPPSPIPTETPFAASTPATPNSSYWLDDEWQPDFDAVIFPSTCADGGDTTVADSNHDDHHRPPESSSTLPLSNPSQYTVARTSTMTTTTIISEQMPSHLSLPNNESPESDVFDQLDEEKSWTGSDGGDSISDPNPFMQERNDSKMNEASSYNDNSNCDNDFGHIMDDTAIMPTQGLSISSWGFDVLQNDEADDQIVIDHDDNAYDPSFSTFAACKASPIDFPTIPTDPTTESIFVPTIWQEDLPITTAANSRTSHQIHDNHHGTDTNDEDSRSSSPSRALLPQSSDLWMSFAENPFQSPQKLPHPYDADPNRSFLIHNNPVDSSSNNSCTMSNNDNVSVSSPSSVVQVAFTQIVDRLPTNKSDTTWPDNGTFDNTKCSF